MGSARDMLSEADVERIANRVAELLAEMPQGGGDRLVSARQLAHILGVSCSYVYANSQVLGARRLGAGPKGRLRFDPAIARERLERIGGTRSAGTHREPPSDATQLPIYDVA
ncbi:MAG: hypothetical protein LC808_33085 [Actinobacteria bacterium]|nr:hypothetical protein [Actinomycetota bacterium]